MTDRIEICIVDDEEIVCERLQPIFEKHGFSVESFTESAGAMRRISEKKFDILITDLKMTQPDGLHLMKFAMQTHPDIRVIIITGFATVETARQAMKDGAVDFIAKPFRISHLSDLVLRTAGEIRK
jgi:DNA-binding NtrC family response regulator